MATAPQPVQIRHAISRPGTEELGAEITRLSAYIYAATYKLLTLIREFDEQDGWHQTGLVSCAHWLNFKCGIGMNAAREKVRVAHALQQLPKISGAFERGELSYSKVRAMTRIADTSNEDYLLMIANHAAAHHVEKLVQKFRRAKRLQDVENANLQHRDRYFNYHYDHDGCLIIKGRLPAEQGALIIKALEKAMDDQFSGVAPDQDAHVAAETGEELSEPEPIAARRADAMVEISETFRNGGEKGGSSADRYQVVMHVTAETPLPSGDRGECHLDDGPHVTAETGRRLACDCSHLSVFEDSGGEPLSIGRKTRSIPPAIRRALRIRDGGCRFPGCTRTKFVDGHHIEHWADGGETSLENLVQLCRHHHRLVHEGGYDCQRTPTGEIFFTAPDERRLPEFAHRHTVDEDPYEWFEKEMRHLAAC